MRFHALDELKGKASTANLTRCHARVSCRDRKADLERRREALESYHAAQDRRTETVSEPEWRLKQGQPDPAVGSRSYASEVHGRWSHQSRKLPPNPEQVLKDVEGATSNHRQAPAGPTCHSCLVG